MDKYLSDSYILGLRYQALERKLVNETDPESPDFDRLLELMKKIRTKQLEACHRELEERAYIN